VDEAVEVARQQWQDGYMRFREDTGDAASHERLLEQVDVVTQELRHRVGSSFTLAELAGAYREADTWVWDVIAEKCPRPGWARFATTAADAAFHLYARGARNYRP
jgi:hypothetical protein